MCKNRKKYANKKSQMKGLAKLTSKEFIEELVWGINLQPFKYPPFYSQCP